MSRSADVVLPGLDEAAALPWVPSRIRTGYRPIAARYGARAVHVPRRGYRGRRRTGASHA